MIKISIVEGRHQAQSRQTKSGTVRYFQEAYVDLGGLYPEQIELPLRAPVDAKQAGKYTLDVSNFRVGKFKNLELNPFEIRLIPSTPDENTTRPAQPKVA